MVGKYVLEAGLEISHEEFFSVKAIIFTESPKKKIPPGSSYKTENVVI